MVGNVLAGVVLAVCGALLLRLLLPPMHRHRIDLTLRRAGLQLRWALQGLPRRWLQRRKTAREAQDVIARARRSAAGKSSGSEGAVPRDGNVYRPDEFKSPKRPDKLH